jgi:hypothetical protein
MAQIAKSGTPSLATIEPGREHKIGGRLAGEAIAAGDACYIKASDGRIYKSTGAAVNAAAKVRGYAATAASIGRAVTLFFGVVFRYGAGLTPGADVFLSAVTPGTLSDIATVGGTVPIGYVIDDTRIFLDRSDY